MGRDGACRSSRPSAGALLAAGAEGSELRTISRRAEPVAGRTQAARPKYAEGSTVENAEGGSDPEVRTWGELRSAKGATSRTRHGTPGTCHDTRGPGLSEQRRAQRSPAPPRTRHGAPSTRHDGRHPCAPGGRAGVVRREPAAPRQPARIYRDLPEW